MSEPQPPPPSNDIISMFNNLVNYLKSHTVDDEITRKDVANVISTSDHIVTYLSTLAKKDDIEEMEEKTSKVIETIGNPMCNVVATIPDVPQEIHIGINEISREVGRSVFYKMTPQTKFQKVFSSFLKRLLFSNGDDSKEIEVTLYFLKYVIYYYTTYIFFSFIRNVVLLL